MEEALIFVYLFCIVISWGLTKLEVLGSFMSTSCKIVLTGKSVEMIN